MAEKCPECGAEWRQGRTCTDEFYQMLAWENEYPGLGEVHHLTVLAYHLQHPSLYSPEGVAFGLEMLEDFVARGVSAQEWRRRSRVKVNSNNRTWKIKGRPGAQGSYARDVRWTMRAADVVAGGPEHYVENVRAWARGIWDAWTMAS